MMHFDETIDKKLNQSESVDSSSIDKNEYIFKEQDFNFISNFMYKTTGIVLTPEKKVMVYARLSKRLRILKLHSFEEYCRMISDPNAPEVTQAINALTTNLTKFFREFHHFEHLQNTVFEDHKKLSPQKPFRIWSAGCSSGEEPYSIAMTAAASFNLNNVDFKILATDIDTQMLNAAQNLNYRTCPEIPQEYFQKFCESQPNNEFRIKPQVKNLVHFKRLNLLEPWPMKTQFDVVFCRNVAIYFDKKTQIELFENFANIIAPNGWLYIGHSENLHHISDRFQLLSKTIYRKVC